MINRIIRNAVARSHGSAARRLLRDTNLVIQENRDRINALPGVYFSLLVCSEAIVGYDEVGQLVSVVRIEEASPEDLKLAELIRGALRHRGWDRVRVELEW